MTQTASKMAKARKYNLKEIYDNRPRYVTGPLFRKHLEKQNISVRTFYRDCIILKDDESSIPTDRLEIYAGLLGVTVEALKNYEAPKIKPLAERKIKPLIKKLGIKTSK